MCVCVCVCVCVFAQAVLRALVLSNTLRVQRMSMALLQRLVPQLRGDALCRAMRPFVGDCGGDADVARQQVLRLLLLSAAQQSVVEERDGRCVPSRVVSFSMGKCRAPCMQGVLTNECFEEVSE